MANLLMRKLKVLKQEESRSLRETPVLLKKTCQEFPSADG